MNRFMPVAIATVAIAAALITVQAQASEDILPGGYYVLAQGELASNTSSTKLGFVLVMADYSAISPYYPKPVHFTNGFIVIGTSAKGGQWANGPEHLYVSEFRHSYGSLPFVTSHTLSGKALTIDGTLTWDGKPATYTLVLSTDANQKQNLSLTVKEGSTVIFAGSYDGKASGWTGNEVEYIAK